MIAVLLFNLAAIMAERIGLIVTLAFILTRWSWFRHLLDGTGTRRAKIAFAFLFGLIGIIGTYEGVVINPATEAFATHMASVSEEEAIVNTRVLGVTIGGLLGGSYVGLAAGVIAGLHRYTLGGFTDFACSLSTVWEGLFAGLLSRYAFRNHIPTVFQAWVVGIVAETGQMLIILLAAQPFEKAYALIKIIGFPMIFGNAAGIAIFIAIIRSVLHKEQEAGATLAHTALAIADETLPYMRNGLTAETAKQVAKIILSITDADAVSLTDRTTILSFAGAGSDHHLPGMPIQTQMTHSTLDEGTIQVARQKADIGCKNPVCPLKSAIVLPLKQHDEIIGSLKLYITRKNAVNSSHIELANGLAKLFSTQLELSRIAEQERLLAEAEYKALQAQLNPHFLFNSLNSIVALIRREPDLARKTSINLAQFLRNNIQASHQQWRSLAAEYQQVQDYLSVESVRFRDKLTIRYDIDETMLNIPVPPLLLLPLIENAIKHGLMSCEQNGLLSIIIAPVPDDRVHISVTDNGNGISAEQMSFIQQQLPITNTKGGGFGLYAISKRISNIYGPAAVFSIRSAPESGTTADLLLPIHPVMLKGENHECTDC